MKCDECGVDKCCWTDLYPVSIEGENLPIYGSLFHPTKKPKRLVCRECLGWDKKEVKKC